MFDDSFNPQKTKPVPPPEKTKSQEEFSSPDLAATQEPVSSKETPSCPDKCELTSPVEIKKEPERDEAKPQSKVVPIKEESDKPKTVKLGKRTAFERGNEFMECLAKVKRESSDDSSTATAWKNATEKENVIKKEEKR